MKEIPYVKDPDDRTSMRCFDDSGDGVTTCKRRKGHPRDTKVVFKLPEQPGDTEIRSVEVVFNHRGSKNGKFYAW